MYEAIMLAGGHGLRLRGDTEIPKPFLIIKKETGETLLEAQLKWLLAHNFEHIILAMSRENFKYMRTNYSKFLNVAAIDISIEEEYLGSAFGLRNALDFTEEPNFYCCNIDDVVFFNPTELFNAPKGHNAILIKQATLPFGEVKFDQNMRVTSFVEKPLIDRYISCGHYVFNRKEIEDLLPDEGDLERTLLSDLARLGLLNSYILPGKFIALNTYKDLTNIWSGKF